MNLENITILFRARLVKKKVIYYAYSKGVEFFAGVVCVPHDM